MLINPEFVVLFISLFAALVGVIGHGIITRLGSIDNDLKSLLVDHGQRITKLETSCGLIDRRESLR